MAGPKRFFVVSPSPYSHISGYHHKQGHDGFLPYAFQLTITIQNHKLSFIADAVKQVTNINFQFFNQRMHFLFRIYVQLTLHTFRPRPGYHQGYTDKPKHM